MPASDSISFQIILVIGMLVTGSINTVSKKMGYVFGEILKSLMYHTYCDTISYINYMHNCLILTNPINIMIQDDIVHYYTDMRNTS